MTSHIKIGNKVKYCDIRRKCDWKEEETMCELIDNKL